jgi:uncharacterized membrane protein
MLTLDNVFLALHVLGNFIWVGGLIALTVLLSAVKREPDAGARQRLAEFARKQGRIADAGATLAILFGAHWLFRFKLYTAHYMHAKLLFVFFLLGLHGFLRAKAKQASSGGEWSWPAFIPPVLVGIVFAIVFFVITKFPA